jgi:hypothetical protein
MRRKTLTRQQFRKTAAYQPSFLEFLQHVSFSQLSFEDHQPPSQWTVEISARQLKALLTSQQSGRTAGEIQYSLKIATKELDSASKRGERLNARLALSEERSKKRVETLRIQVAQEKASATEFKRLWWEAESRAEKLANDPPRISREDHLIKAYFELRAKEVQYQSRIESLITEVATLNKRIAALQSIREKSWSEAKADGSVAKPLAKLVPISEEGTRENYVATAPCRKCGGNGGARGRCPRCMGNGLDPG